MNTGHFARKVCAAAMLMSSAAMSVTALPAGAQVTTDTQHVTVSDPPSPDVNPCTGDVGLFSDSGKGVFHSTNLANGTSHFTGTIVIDLLFVPNDSTKATVTGRGTFWFGENVNSKNYTATSTSSITAFGSDG